MNDIVIQNNSYYRYTETEKPNSIFVHDVGWFELVNINDSERKMLISRCNEWEWTTTKRSWTDYTGADWEFCVDDDDDYYSEKTYRLMPHNCIVKDGEVIGFYHDGAYLLISNPFYINRSQTNDDYPTVTSISYRLTRK